jgi:hypothetical protein
MGWGNLALGIATPIAILSNIVAGLEVFSLSWAGDAIFLAIILGSILGYLTGRSGWGILKGKPWAFRRTCIVGGLTLGYTFTGILVMVTQGIDRGLPVLFRHGSENWWDWTLSHFQNSPLREIPLFIWWVLVLVTVLQYRLYGAPETTRDRIVQGVRLIFWMSVFGLFARLLQMSQDSLLSSQR